MGFIKLHRDIKDWEWYGDPYMVAFWIHLLITANCTEKDWMGEIICRGQMVTSLASLSAVTGLSVKQVRTALDRLALKGYIVTNGTSRWTKITICNYDSYCVDDDSKGQTKSKQVETTKENNNASISEAVERIYALYPSRTNRPEGNIATLKTAKKDKAKIHRMLSSGEYTEDALTYAIKRYLSESKPEYLKVFQTFLNQVPDYSDQPSIFETQTEEEREWPNGIKPQKV